MFFSRKFTLGMFQRSVRNVCPKIVRNEGKSVRKLNNRNFNVRLQVMQSMFLDKSTSMYMYIHAQYVSYSLV